MSPLTLSGCKVKCSTGWIFLTVPFSSIPGQPNYPHITLHNEKLVQVGLHLGLLHVPLVLHEEVVLPHPRLVQLDIVALWDQVSDGDDQAWQLGQLQYSFQCLVSHQAYGALVRQEEARERWWGGMGCGPK